MSNKSSSIPNSVTKTLICVDHKADSDFSGVLYNPFMREPFPFKQAKDIISVLEDFFNGIDYPQPYFEDRSFLETKAEPGCKGQRVVERHGDADMLDDKKGKLATFVVQVRYRQNATWQGEFLWREGGESCSFRSTLELLMLMDKIVSGSDTVTGA